MYNNKIMSMLSFRNNKIMGINNNISMNNNNI